MPKTWRDHARPLIAEAIDLGRKAGLNGKPLRDHVHRAFPWGTREHHPYEIWKSEAALQLGISRKRSAGTKPMPLFGE